MAEDILDLTVTANRTLVTASAAAGQANSSNQPRVSDWCPATTNGAVASASGLDNHATVAGGNHAIVKDHVSFNADSDKDASDTMEFDDKNKASDKNDDSDSDEDFDPANPSVLDPDADIINMCDEDEEDGAEEEEGQLSSDDDVEGPPDGARLEQIKSKCQKEDNEIVEKYFEQERVVSDTRRAKLYSEGSFTKEQLDKSHKLSYKLSYNDG